MRTLSHFLGLSCLVLAGCGGCGSDAAGTEVSILIDAQRTAKDQSAALRFRVWSEEGEELYDEQSDAIRSRAMRFDLSPAGGDATRKWIIEASLLDGEGETIATARRTGGWVMGERREYHICFTRECLGTLCEAAGCLPTSNMDGGASMECSTCDSEAAAIAACSTSAVEVPRVSLALPGTATGCPPEPPCVIREEGFELSCANPLDDDCDGLFNCADEDCDGRSCAEGKSCVFEDGSDGECVCDREGPETDCGNGVDDDCDGETDCADADCAGATCAENSLCDGGGCVCDTGLAAVPEICNDGVDNDCDRQVDCADPDCTEGTNCGPLTATCDGTGQCLCPHGAAPAPERCDDGVDNDCDSLVDCADTEDCAGATCGAMRVCAGTDCECASGAPIVPEDCIDNRDNDCDGLIDCRDPDCNGQRCHATAVAATCRSGNCNCPGGDPNNAPERTCRDGRDNDCDGLVDCGSEPSCNESIVENCSNGLDDDCDGHIDCADPECCNAANRHCFNRSIQGDPNRRCCGGSSQNVNGNDDHCGACFVRCGGGAGTHCVLVPDAAGRQRYSCNCDRDGQCPGTQDCRTPNGLSGPQRCRCMGDAECRYGPTGPGSPAARCGGGSGNYSFCTY